MWGYELRRRRIKSENLLAYVYNYVYLFHGDKTAASINLR